METYMQHKVGVGVYKPDYPQQQVTVGGHGLVWLAQLADCEAGDLQHLQQLTVTTFDTDS